MKKKIHEALISLGFEKSGRYYKKGGNSIKIYDYSKLDEVFDKLIEFGETKKLWEIQRTLGI